MRYTVCLLAALLTLAACSPRDHFWKKPDIGERFTALDKAQAATPLARNLWLYNQALESVDPQLAALVSLERLSLRKNKLTRRD